MSHCARPITREDFERRSIRARRRMLDARKRYATARAAFLALKRTASHDRFPSGEYRHPQLKAAFRAAWDERDALAIETLSSINALIAYRKHMGWGDACS